LLTSVTRSLDRVENRTENSQQQQKFAALNSEIKRFKCTWVIWLIAVSVPFQSFFNSSITHPASPDPVKISFCLPPSVDGNAGFSRLGGDCNRMKEMQEFCLALCVCLYGKHNRGNQTQKQQQNTAMKKHIDG
jgi:hypothetical protein